MNPSSRRQAHLGGLAPARTETAGLRRPLAALSVSALVLGAVFAGPSVAFANDEASSDAGAAPTLVEDAAAEEVGADGAPDPALSVDGETIEPTEQGVDPALDASDELSTGSERLPADQALDAVADSVVFDNVFIVQPRQYQGGAVDVAYAITIPDSVKAGDTIQLAYQAPLEYDNSIETVLKDADGVVVATGKLTDLENRIITFTFTDYVDKKKNVTIAGEFAMIANDPTLDGNLDGVSTTHEITFAQGELSFTDTLVIDPHSRTPLTKVFNYGVWTAEDKGHKNPEEAILWTANSPEGSWEGATVTLEPANGTSSFECSTLQFYTIEVPDGALYHNTEFDNEEQRTLSGSIANQPTFVKSVTCTEDRIEVVYDGHVDDNFVRQFTVKAGVNDRDEIGHFGSVIRGTDFVHSADAVACPDPIWGGTYVDYAPACTLEDTHWYNFVARDAAVGGGTGENRDASISIEKFSTDEGLAQGDYDTTPGKSLKKDTTEKITFEITNTGEETLTNISLVDTTIVGAELEMTQCDLDGLSLAAGESATCEGEVTVSTPGQHGDTATVTASARGGIEVSDTDDWWGAVAPDPTDPPVNPADPEKPVDPQKPDQHGNLAVTGHDAPWLLVLLAGFLAVGGGAVHLLSRRQTKRA
ncbi:hypothetical protein EDF62_3028 [Leucobacter luti]|uniref:Uncharacterized protein n=1 Tax=Leucobacter luti TaxID=340320 RepID=A0A4R6RSA3_9MICO|nr:Ig-like domain-containing protein [Leucobacter luti]TDP89731.1 hypothetical protein EDF62_3028 [Leucobacter luti]